VGKKRKVGDLKDLFRLKVRKKNDFEGNLEPRCQEDSIQKKHCFERNIFKGPTIPSRGKNRGGGKDKCRGARPKKIDESGKRG